LAYCQIGFRWGSHYLWAFPSLVPAFGGFRKRAKDLPMSSNDYAIKVEYLSKRYQIYNRPEDRLKQSIVPRLQSLVGRPPRTYFHEFWALRDISFEISKGETIGIIGRNGSGKSTLLQLICGTLTPTSGTVLTNGRVAALLELGSGFNPEFTGRENVYLNGAILGLSKAEIDNRFDDIAAFADIGEFIEQPVKMYSSGMYVRLAFAINIMSQPDIMIVDEALAVGDMKFQAKCMTALKRRQESGTTVLFVSHDIGTIKSLCSRGIYLEHGELKSIGTAGEIAEHYIRIMREEMNAEQSTSLTTAPQVLPKGKKNNSAGPVPAPGFVLKRSDEFDRRVAQFRYGTGEARITYVELLNTADEPIALVEFDQSIKIRIFFEAYESKTLSVNFIVMDDKKNNITGSNLLLAGLSLLEGRSGNSYQIDYSVRLPLAEGEYSIQVALSEPVIPDQTANFVDVVSDAVVFSISRWKRSKVWSKVYLFPTVEIQVGSQYNMKFLYSSKRFRQ
jgi:lipopolysaccharide transport system ATP-binding protein